MEKVRIQDDTEFTNNLTDSIHDTVDSKWVWAEHYPREARAFIDLLTVGDRLRINDRTNPLTVVEKEYGTNPHRCNVILEGNGTSYRLGYDNIAAQGPLTFVRLSDLEHIGCTHAKCANRNPFLIPAYDNLLTEEIESVPPVGENTYRDVELHVTGETMWTIVTALRVQVQFYRSSIDLTVHDFDHQYRAILALQLASEEMKHGQSTDGITFYGAEKGWVGAVLDYGIEDMSLNVADQFRTACEAARERINQGQ